MNLKLIKSDYHNQTEEVTEILVNAVHDLLQEITGKEMPDRTRDELRQILRFF